MAIVGGPRPKTARFDASNFSVLGMVRAMAGLEQDLYGQAARYGAPSLVAARYPCQNPSAAGSPGHDSGIASEAGAEKGADMQCVVYGPFEDRGKYRVRVVDTETKRAKGHTFLTLDDAERAIPRLKREYERSPGKPLAKALEDYRAFLKEKGNRPRSVETTIERMTTLFSRGGILNVISGDLTPKRVAEAWEAYVSTPGQRKALPAVDTRSGVLKQARTFLGWAEKKGWSKPGLLEGIEVLGERRRGKAQFVGVDESRKFLAKALDMGARGDSGAIAAAVALVMGMRASEIADRIVRELDDDGRVLVIRAAKTRAGIRRLRIPEVLRGPIGSLTRGKAPEDRIFATEAGGRHWVLRAVRRVCLAAGLPVVSAHGLRGTHATLAVGAGITGDAVAAALGHESFEVTARHYASEDSVAGAMTDRVAAVFSTEIPREKI